jgi:hypothetical protein
VSPENPLLKEDISSHKFYMRYFHLLPNTVLFNFSEYSSTLTIDNTRYGGKASSGSGFTDQVWNYLSSISLQHNERPRDGTVGHWVFDFVPAVLASGRKIRFQEYAPLKDVTFQRMYVSGGFGAEVGHLSRYGFFYFDLIPVLTWSRINVRQPTFDYQVEHSRITTMTEGGYSYFFTNHLVVKFYLRGLSEDNVMWEKAVQAVTGGKNSVSAANSNLVGLAIGYYIPASFRERREGWKILPHSGN